MFDPKLGNFKKRLIAVGRRVEKNEEVENVSKTSDNWKGSAGASRSSWALRKEDGIVKTLLKM